MGLLSSRVDKGSGGTGAGMICGISCGEAAVDESELRKSKYRLCVKRIMDSNATMDQAKGDSRPRRKRFPGRRVICRCSCDGVELRSDPRPVVRRLCEFMGPVEHFWTRRNDR